MKPAAQFLASALASALAAISLGPACAQQPSQQPTTKPKSAPTQEAATEQDPVRLAEAAAQRGDAKEAAERFVALAKARPHEPILAVRAGEWLGAAGRLNDAISLLMKGQETFPDVPDFGSLLARTMLLKAENDLAGGSGLDLNVTGYYEQAIEVCEQVMERHPDHRDAHLIRAQALFQLNRWEDAYAAAKAAAERFPSHPGAPTLLGHLAANACRSMLHELRDNDALSKTDRTNLVAMRDQFHAEANQAFKKAIALDPDRGAPHRSLGDLAIAMGRTDEALDHYRAALAVAPNTPIDHTWLQNNVTHDKRLALYEGALADYEERTTNTKPAPERGVLLWYKGKAHLDLGQFEQGLAAFERALTERPTDLSAHYYALVAAWWNGDADKAAPHAAAYASADAAAFADTIRDLPEAARDNVIGALEYLAAQAREKGEAVPCRDINRVVAFTKGTADAWNNYALLCWEGGQHQEAYDTYLRALEIEPNSPQLLNDAGAVLQHHMATEDNLKLARAFYSKAIAAADQLLADPRTLETVKARARTARDNAKANLAELK